MLHLSRQMDAARQRGGVVGLLKRAGLGVATAATFARLYLLPTMTNSPPERVTIAPVW